METHPTLDLVGVGEDIAAKLRANFPPATEVQRQVLALAEEAGEFVGAYRRWAGYARRVGEWADVEAELADVIITAHVTAAAMGVRPLPPDPVPFEGIDGSELPLAVFNQTTTFLKSVNRGNAVARYTPDEVAVNAALTLAQVVGAAYAAAGKLGINVEEVCRAKINKVMSRGWRDRAPGSGTPEQPRPVTVEELVYDKFKDEETVEVIGFVNGGVKSHTSMPRNRPWCEFKLYGTRRVINARLMPGPYAEHRRGLDPVITPQGGVHPALIEATGKIHAWDHNPMLQVTGLRRLALGDIAPGTPMGPLVQAALDARTAAAAAG